MESAGAISTINILEEEGIFVYWNPYKHFR
jgi:hypothetical protein